MAVDTTEANLYGINRGAAQVWGQNRALGMLQQQYQQDQLRRQKEDAEVADQVSKINYDAARTEDLPEILNRYGKIKNIFTQMRGTQNAMDRIKLQAQLNQEKAELTRGVNMSKQAARQLGDLGKLRLTNPDEISDDFTPRYKTLNSLSVFDPKFTTLAEETAATALVPKFDELSTMKKIADASIKKIPQSDIKSQNVGGGKSYYREAGQLLDKDAFATNVASEVAKSRGMQNQVKRLYPDLPFVDAVKAYTDDRYNGMKGAYNDMKKTGATVIKPDDWKEKADYTHHLAMIRKGVGEGSSGNVQPISIPYAKGKANVDIEEYVPISVSKKNFAGSEYIDLKTGKPGGKLSSSNDYEIVGVGNAPFILSGNMKGAISQPNFAKSNPNAITNKPIIHVQQPSVGGLPAKDFFVPYDRLPENVKNSKSIREALSKFKPATGQQKEATVKIKQQQSTTGKKSIPGWSK